MSHGNFIRSTRLTSSFRAADSLAVVAHRSTGHHNPDVGRWALPWHAASAWGAMLCIAYPLLAVAPLVALRILNPDSDHSFITELGVNCALVGFTLLSLQFVLTARLAWIEAPFGLDILLRFHRAMAFVILSLLCAHPVLIASSESWRLLTRFNVHGYIWAGRIALFLLAAQITTALLRLALRLSYERWRHIHNVIALAILTLGIAHGLTAVAHDLTSAAQLTIWVAAPSLALATWFYSRAIRPHLLARNSFRVQAVKLEANRVWTVTLTPPAGKPFHFSPGQFQFLRLIDSSAPAEEHPFTIASSPSRNTRISLTIKACGDFTSLTHHIHVGDRATVHGPFGRFSHDLHPDKDHLVFVAGGVGITPLMSMLRAMRDRREPRQVTLIYACRALDDILFPAELLAMEASQSPLVRVIYVLSQPPPGWAGQTGRVDVRRLAQWCSGLHNKAFYLCCPSEMNTDLIRDLRRHGVSPRRIHGDYFSL